LRKSFRSNGIINQTEERKRGVFYGKVKYSSFFVRSSIGKNMKEYIMIEERAKRFALIIRGDGR